MTIYSFGPLEQEVMTCLWRDNNATVRQVYNCLKKNRKIAYTTVMTIMSRLESKGFLTRKKKGKAYIYSPKKDKEQTAKRMIKKIVNTLIDQFGKEAITAFTDELKKEKI